MDLLATICAKAVGNGNIVQGILSAADNDVTNILNNEALFRKNAWQDYYCTTYANGIKYAVPQNDKFRFVSVVTGYATISTDYNGFIFQSGLGPTVVGLMSILDDGIAVSGRELRAVRLLTNMSQSEADLLSTNGFIPTRNTTKAIRGVTDEAVALADNNMGVVSSELRQTGVLRLTRRIAYRVKNNLRKHVGTSGDGIKESVKEVMDEYRKRGIIRRYDFSISRPAKNPYKVLILIQFLPYFSARVIEVSIVAGSNQS
jgi:hypothetical protein